jgi:hypothetical protein
VDEPDDGVLADDHSTADAAVRSTSPMPSTTKFFETGPSLASNVSRRPLRGERETVAESPPPYDGPGEWSHGWSRVPRSPFTSRTTASRSGCESRGTTDADELAEPPPGFRATTVSADGSMPVTTWWQVRT